METGIELVTLGGKDFEVHYEADAGRPARGYAPPEDSSFVVTKIALVCSAFIGHDPVKIDMTEVFNAVGGEPTFAGKAEAQYLYHKLP